MQKIALESLPRMPWKNAGGVTQVLAIEPPGAGLDDFDWRISCTQVASSGAFSAFPGVDRSVLVLQGAGLQLRIGEAEDVTLDADGAVLCFRGEQPVTAELLSGPLSDFNVMTRRTRYTHELLRTTLCGEQCYRLSADATLIFCATGHVTCRVACAAAVELDAQEGLLLERAEADWLTLTATLPSSLCIVRLCRV